MRHSWIILYATILHWIWGIMLLSSNAPINVTAISSITKVGLTSPASIGTFCLTASFLALLGMFSPKPIGAIFFIPQQLILVVSAFGAIMAMSNGSYADGVQRPVPFLIADQAPAVVGAFCHFMGVYFNYLRKPYE
jgi:hypothetical protein